MTKQSKFSTELIHKYNFKTDDVHIHEYSNCTALNKQGVAFICYLHKTHKTLGNEYIYHYFILTRAGCYQGSNVYVRRIINSQHYN